MSEVDVKNRIRRECPLCPGAALVQGTCPVCNNDFSTVHLSYQKKMRIAAEAMGYANLKLLIAGTLAALGKTLRDQEGLNAVGRVIDGPTVIPEFNRLVATDSLPTLVLVDRPAVFDDPKELRRVDAFHRNLGGK